MEKKIYEVPHIQVIALEYDSCFICTSPGDTFTIGTNTGEGGNQNGASYDESPDDID